MARTGRIIGPAMAGLAGPEITPLHIVNPFCRNVINSLARVITCAAYACYHVLLCVWHLCEKKNESWYWLTRSIGAPQKSYSVWKELSSVLQASNTASATRKVAKTSWPLTIPITTYNWRSFNFSYPNCLAESFAASIICCLEAIVYW